MTYRNNNLHFYDETDFFDVLEKFLLHFIIFGSYFSIAFALVGSFIYRKPDNFTITDEDYDEDDEDEDEEDDYETLYYDELDELEERTLNKEDLEKLGKTFIREKTPHGEVIMTYNSNTETFWYYCDDKNIKYTILDTVARKFTIDNNCKSICVNYKEEFEKAKAAIMAQEVTITKDKDKDSDGLDDSSNKNTDTETDTGSDKQPQPQQEPVKKSIYAKFKSYNTTYKRSQLPKEKTSGENSVKSKNTDIYILTEKANRFTYKGRISDYKDPSVVEEKTTIFKKQIDFATFKKELYNKND